MLPPGVLVNSNLEVLQFRGRTSPYLEPPTGEASFNLLKMARENLSLELGTAIREAKKKNGIVRRNVRLDDHDNGSQSQSGNHSSKIIRFAGKLFFGFI